MKVEWQYPADKLIKNPSYYVEKGNELQQCGLYRLAVNAYGRAIDLDPPYSSIARFNKVMALVSSTSNKCNQSEAKRELKAGYPVPLCFE